MVKRAPITDDTNLDDLDPAGGNGSSDEDGTGGQGDEDRGDDGDDLDDVDDDTDEDGDDEGDGEGADDATGGGQGDDRTERVAGRASQRIRNLNAEVRREREAREALQRRFDEFARTGGSQQQQQPVRESDEQRRARRALMSTEERHEEDMAEMRALVISSTNRATVTSQDAADRASFEAKAGSDTLYRKWGPKVEAERARLAGLGQYVAREAILIFMIGEAALKARGAGGGKKQRALADRRVQRQTVGVGSSRGDASQSRRGGRSLEERLADQPI